MATMKWMVLSFTLILGQIAFSQDSNSESRSTCPMFGTDESQQPSASTEERIFMNFERPSQCRGNVTSWHYCYYEPEDRSDDLFAVRFIVYRRQSSSSDTYERVEGSVRNIQIPIQNLSTNEFECLSETLNPSEQFEIQENDIIGACIMDTTDTDPLNIVGISDGTVEQSLYQVDRTNRQRCTDGQIQSVDTTHDSFTERFSSRLHLYVNIDSNAGCRGGSNSPLSFALTASGTYINTQQPIECNGTITTWHYCYYPANASDTATTYTAEVGVWRLDPMSRQYNLIQGSLRNISLQPVARQLAKIVCIEERNLNSNQYLLEGDMIGVILPSDNPIPLISWSEDDSVRSHTSTSAASFPETETIVVNLALHLYADLDAGEFPITTSSTVSPTSTTTTTTTQSTDVMANKLSGGAIFGIIFCVLLLLICIMIGLIVLGVILWRKRDHFYSITGKKTLGTNQLPHPIDNAIYSAINGELDPTSLDPNAYEVPIDTKESTYEDPNYEDPNYEQPLRSHQASISAPCPTEEAPVYECPSEVNTGTDWNFSNGTYYSPLDMPVIQYSALLEKNKEEDIYGDLDQYQAPPTHEEQLYKQIKSCGVNSIPAEKIQCIGYLGSGQFGNVEQGVLNLENGKEISVALKTLNKEASDDDKVKLLQEAAIMAQFRHPNIVSLFGIVKEGESMMLVVEFMEKGDLKEMLIALRPSLDNQMPSGTAQMLLAFSQQVALGMQYLAAKGFIHRDLAARNILVTKDNVCKIADFGMSRDLAEENCYISSGGKIPLKWTALEAILYKQYSTASDIWSYGCLLYEIWSVGYKPFEGQKNTDVVSLISAGTRLPPPPGCPKLIYELMIICWNSDTSQRPCFRDLVLALVGSSDVVLHIPQEALDTHPQAGMLGAPLQAGVLMYKVLQDTFKNQESDEIASK